MASTIVNQFGRPYESPARYAGTEDDRYRLNRPRLDHDMATLLSRYKHKMLINDARWIRETFPLVGGAVEQKADYVSAAGWLPEFYGKDQDWGLVATEKLHQALNIADVRGALFDWSELWWTANCSLDVDGGVFAILTETATGFPQCQFIEAHRIGQRSPSRTVAPGDAYSLVSSDAGGPPQKVPSLFAGSLIINGIIYDAAACEIGYRVLGETQDQDRDIPARDMVHITHPRWFSDGRPFPSIAYSVLDWYDVKEAREFQRIKQKVNAAITLVESNDTGAPPSIPTLGSGPSPAPTDGSVEPHTQMLMGGLVRYVRAGSGKLEAHESNSPSDGWRQFDRTVVAGALFGMGWRIEMLDLSLLGGAGVRGFQDNINTVIYARHRRLSRPAIRIINYFVAKLVKRGDLTANPDWWKWLIPQPPEFNVDAARGQQQDRDNIRFGLDSHPDTIRRSLGTGYMHVLRKQAKYIADKKSVAEEFGLQPDELATNLKVGDSANTVDLIGHNPAASPSAAPDAPAAREAKPTPYGAAAFLGET